jgi:hypothetical protein
VVKHADAAELRVVATAVLAVAAVAALVAHHLPKLCAHLVTALACLNVRNLERRNSLGAWGTREKKAGRAEKRKELRVAIWQGKQEMPVARSNSFSN